MGGTTTSYTYNADGEKLTSVQGSTTESAATWNGAGQLATYNNSATDMTAATYDGTGLRASTTMTPSGGSAATQEYVWNAQSAVPQLLLDGSNAYIYSTGIAPAEQISLATGTITYLAVDLLGCVRGTVSSTGALTATTVYDAWGNPETSGGLTAATPFGYAGGYTDSTGLIYLINRYYDPQVGQFISVDPALAQTQQPYEYANGNPVSQTDPTGQWSSAWCDQKRCTNTDSFSVGGGLVRTIGILGGSHTGSACHLVGIEAMATLAAAVTCVVLGAAPRLRAPELRPRGTKIARLCARCGRSE